MIHAIDDRHTIAIIQTLSDRFQVQAVAACAGVSPSTLVNIARFGAMPYQAAKRKRIMKCAELNAHAQSKTELRFVE